MFRRKRISKHAPIGPAATLSEKEIATGQTDQSWHTFSMANEFEIGQRLGSGSYGAVYEVQDKDGNVFAAKVGELHKNECAMQKKAYAKAQLAPEVFVCGSNFITMELLEGEPLLDWLEQSEGLDLDSYADVFDGVLQIHDLLSKASIAHNDAHLRNIIVTNSGWRLVDYGAAHPGEEPWGDTKRVFPYIQDIVNQQFPEAKAGEEVFDDLYTTRDYIKHLRTLAKTAVHAEDTAALLNKLFRS